MNLETLVLLDECLLSNDNKLDETKQQMTAKKEFLILRKLLLMDKLLRNLT